MARMSGGETTTEAARARPLRADAERNRTRILAAAKELFAERGLTSLDDVAARAGVGVGTVYRRFPSRDDLVDALFDESVETIVGHAKRAYEIADEDPYAGLEYFVTRYLELHAADRSLSQVLMTDLHGRQTLELKKKPIKPHVFALVERAKQAGVVREDLAPTDVPMLLLMLVSLMNATRDVAPELWRRQLRLALDGIRPGGTPFGAPALEPDDVALVMRAAFGRP